MKNLPVTIRTLTAVARIPADDDDAVNETPSG